MAHEEYGQGFIDGFNAALKSDYLKEKFQAADRKELLNEIKSLNCQLTNVLNQQYVLSGMAIPLCNNINSNVML